MNSQPTTAKLLVPNDLESIGKARDRFQNDVDRQAYDASKRSALVLGLVEAMANAFKHGNRQDPNKYIVIYYRLGSAIAELEVADQGDGFAPDSVPDPTTATNVIRANGRGVWLMRSLFNSVEYRQGGRQVRLTIHFDAMP